MQLFSIRNVYICRQNLNTMLFFIGLLGFVVAGLCFLKGEGQRFGSK